MRALLPAILMIAFSAAAQEFPVKGPATNDPTANSSQLVTYEGCMADSNNSLMLDATSGRQFQLVGDLSLKSYVGKEVRVNAHNVNPNDPSSSERSMSAADPRNVAATLKVVDIQKVANTCNKPKK